VDLNRRSKNPCPVSGPGSSILRSLFHPYAEYSNGSLLRSGFSRINSELNILHRSI
jgi:hypothetical protein